MIERISESKVGLPGYQSPPFYVSMRSEGSSAWVVEVHGELDMLTGPMLTQQLELYNDPVGQNGHSRTITYLLSDLTFMDARGLHYLLLTVDGHAEAITIRDPSPIVRRLLEVVGLDWMIEERAIR